VRTIDFQEPIIVLIEKDGREARRFFVDRERCEDASFGRGQAFRASGEEFEHRRIVFLGWLLKPVEDPVTLAPLSDFITAFFDEGPESLRKDWVQRFDYEDDVEVLGRSEVETDIVHHELAGRPADQDILPFMTGEMVTKTLHSSYHPKGSSN